MVATNPRFPAPPNPHRKPKTAIEAIKQAIELWDLIPKSVNAMAKQEALDALGMEDYLCGCPLCQFSIDTIEDEEEMCMACPVFPSDKFGDNGCIKYSCYNKWDKTTDSIEARKYAQQFADFLRQALQRAAHPTKRANPFVGRLMEKGMSRAEAVITVVTHQVELLNNPDRGAYMEANDIDPADAFDLLNLPVEF